MGEYETKMNSFSSMETMALEVYNLPDNTPKDKFLHEIKDRGIYYWIENTKLLHEIEKLNLPEEIHDRNKVLLHYCDLRLKSYNLIYKSVDEETDQYEDSLDIYGKDIEALFQSFSQE